MTPREIMMVTKLMEQVAIGAVDDDWCEQFICDMDEKRKKNMVLSTAQAVKLEELFDQY